VHKTVGVIEILAPGNSPYLAHFPAVQLALDRQLTGELPPWTHQANDRIAKMPQGHANQPIWTPGGDALRYPYDHPYAARELGCRARANVAGPHEATAAAPSSGQRSAASHAGGDG
jgi:hypothetical protein